MAQKFEYIYESGDLIHVLQVKPSANSKLGTGRKVLQTYHFNKAQLDDFTQDSANCLNCPFSFNQNGGKSGGCYTHKGQQLMGLKSMLRRLKRIKNDIKPLNSRKFLEFFVKAQAADLELVRFGAYGEAILLDAGVKDYLFSLQSETTKVTTYTHAHKEIFDPRFTVSAHSYEEAMEAKEKYDYPMAFIVTPKGVQIDKRLAVVCPASKEAGKRLTCATCGLCAGSLSKSNKPVQIQDH